MLRFDCTVVGDLSHAKCLSLLIGFAHSSDGYLPNLDRRTFVASKGLFYRILTLHLRASKLLSFIIFNVLFFFRWIETFDTGMNILCI